MDVVNENLTSNQVRFDLGDNFTAIKTNVEYGKEYTEDEVLGAKPGDHKILSQTWVLERHLTPFKTKVVTENFPTETGYDLVQFFEKEILAYYYGNEKRYQWLLNQTSDDDALCPPWKRQFKARKINLVLHTFTDDGNAFRFADECQGWLVFDKSSKKWFAWEMNHWEEADEKLLLAARFVARTIPYERDIWESYNEQMSHEFENFAKKSNEAYKINAMISLAEPSMTVDFSECANMDLLACQNCVIDCKTKKIYFPWEYDELKTLYPVVYVDCCFDRTAKAVEWKKELFLLMSDDSLPENLKNARAAEMSAYIMKCLGYGLYPGNPSRKILFFYGNGGNGKSIISDVLSGIFGNQFGKASMAQIFSGSADHASPTLVDALPARYLVFSEADGESGKVSTSAIKDIASGEEYAVRFRKMHANNTKVKILCLPIAVTNSLPVFDKPLKKAELDRFVTIEFSHEFTKEDRSIKGKLLAEKDEIFSLLVNSLFDYIDKGCVFPDLPEYAQVSQGEFLAGADLYQFFSENYEKTDDPVFFVERKDIIEKFMEYADSVSISYTEKVVRDVHGCPVGKTVSNADAKRIFDAAKMLGFEETKYGGVRGFKHMRAVSHLKG